VQHLFLLKFFRTAAVLAAGLSVTSAQAESDPMLGDLMPVGFNFCPRGWAAAEGQLLPINQYQAVYSLLGTTYGGDGRTTFGLPDLRGRMPVGFGNSPQLGIFNWGQKSGVTTTSMTVATMPAHNHLVNATNEQGDKLGPGGDYLADPNTDDPNTEVQIYHDGGILNNERIMHPQMIAETGSSQPFSVQDPYLAIGWCIALQGVFPSRN